MGKDMFQRRPIILCFYFLSLLILLEAWHRSNIIDVFKWLGDKPILFFFNLLLLYLFFLVLKLLTRRIRVALWVLSLSMLTFFTISRIKLNLKGEPFLPWDFSLGKEAAKIGEYFNLVSIGDVTFLFLLALFFILVPFAFSNQKLEAKMGGVMVLLSMLLIILFYVNSMNGQVHWHQSISYQVNGVQGGFIQAIKEMRINEPDGYSETTINELREQFSKVESSLGKKPNIIFIMNEAFWDPMRLTNVKFNEDPLPFFRELQQNYTSGNLLAPVFGGSTANTEFEVLTGSSMHLLPHGTLAYAHFIRGSQPSLASILSEEGYRAVAIHTYLDWFYQRDVVYEQFGFEQFFSLENFINPEYRRGFIADMEMSRRIMKEHQSSEEPLFIFAVTMQNHSPFDLNQYDEDRIKVTGPFSSTLEKKMSTYSTGVKDADDSLKLLVDYFEKIEDPTVIVFFGDHLPLLGDLYTESNYINDINPKHWSIEEYQKMYSVPFVVWDNFQQEKQSELYMNSSFLGAYVLDQYALQQPPFMKFLNEVRKNDRPIISANNGINEISDEFYKKYQLLQYQQLFGE
ncbi:MAG: LTA synthase family protein [Anaerobacillus sp.]|uniref:LTA synthase family protein n=1 Tax=Anaerobacillus sp. TaxID=1872506 RepID=UPI00391B9315